MNIPCPIKDCHWLPFSDFADAAMHLINEHDWDMQTAEDWLVDQVEKEALKTKKSA